MLVPARVTLEDLLSELPDLKDISEWEELCSRTLFICACGFEDRSPHVLEQVALGQAPQDLHVLVLEYPMNRDDNQRYKARFEMAAERAKGTIEFQEYDRRTVRGTVRRILAREAPEAIVLDISAMASFMLLPVFAECFLYEQAVVNVAYCEAQTYFPTEEEWRKVADTAAREEEESLFVDAFEQAEFQSSGIEHVYALDLFAAQNRSILPSRLVAIPNFSATRMNAIIRKDEEQNKTRFEDRLWIIGEPPRSDTAWRADAVMRTNGLSKVGSQRRRTACTRDYRQLLEVLEDIWISDRYERFMTIGSLGSKMQHVGLFLFNLIHPDVSIWLTEPERFRASRFSEGTGQAFVLEFGVASQILETLREYNQFRWRPLGSKTD